MLWSRCPAREITSFYYYALIYSSYLFRILILSTLLKMKKTLFKTHFKPFSQNLKDLPLLSVILSDVHIGVTLQHMGAYRELSMLKESEKLTPEAVANHWAETT